MKSGQTLKIFVFLIIVVLVITILTFNAVSQMIFGVIERTPESPVWGYGIALSISLGINGITNLIMILAKEKSILLRIATIISGATSGAILGFFYGGIAASGKNLQIAIATAVILALMMATISFYSKKRFISVILSVVGTVTSYGFAFLIGTRAIAFLSTQNFVWGLILSVLSLIYIGFTLISLRYTVAKIKSYGILDFRF